MKKFLSMLLTPSLVLSITAGGSTLTAFASENADADYSEQVYTEEEATAATTDQEAMTVTTSDQETTAVATSDQAYIEETLNLANNPDQTWTYQADADAWVLSVVSAVAYPELPDQQGVSVCVPGAYVTGIDTDGDGSVDVTAADFTDTSIDGEETTAAENMPGEDTDGSGDSANAVCGSLVIDYDAEITSTNGQVYTAATAPVILNTGAAGYGSSNNTAASTSHAADGYINVSCGNRGKKDTATAEDGTTYYTGDAPSCLSDQKAATRFVKYNILLGNLPGSTDYFVSTGGSGGGAHAAMFAATSNNPDFYDYQIEAGAVGVYRNEDGSYSTTVTIDGTEYDLSDGAWGCIAYSPITSLYEADMAMAFEYYMDTTYDFNSSFQAQLASYLSESYMEYINSQELSVEESAVGFDLNGDGDMEDTIALTIEYDLEAHPETNGYYGTYLDLYLAEFTENLQWYLDNLDYSEGWTWFDADGSALSDEAVAAMTSEEKAAAFLEGRYAKGSSGGMDMMGGMGMMGGMRGGNAGGEGGGPGQMGGGELPDGFPMDGEMPENAAGSDAAASVSESALPDDATTNAAENALQDDTAAATAENALPENATGELPGDMAAANADASGDEMLVGTPDAGTTQSASSTVDSSTYATYEEMLAAYQADIASIEAGDKYGNNIVSLYNPLNYIDAEGTENPTWIKMMMGASEGDMSLFASLNLQIAFLNAGVDAEVEWQWDGGHVPSEVLGESFSLYVDQMYAAHVDGANEITKSEATPQTENGDATEATGKDISSWVDSSDITNVSISLADAAAYRTAGASKATPGFDVIDYGQEDYVFGNSETDARHWDTYLLEILETYADVLEPLFNLAD